MTSIPRDPDPEGQPDFTIINGEAVPRNPGTVNKPAGVLVLVRPIAGAPHVVFMRRSDKVQNHKGEVSFPGGGYKPDVDPDMTATALREAHEEVGVRPEQVRVLGGLPARETYASSYIVYPFVAVLRDPTAPVTYVADEFEVAEIIELPLASLANPAALVNDVWTIRGRRVGVYYYTVNGVTVWGATARILHDLLTAMADGTYAEATDGVIVPAPVAMPRVVLLD